MLSQRTRNVIKLFLLLLLLTASLIVFNPLALYIERFMLEKKGELIAFVGEKTGVSFDYEAISPSILKHIVIKKITLFDYERKEQIGHAEKIQIEYNIWNLIRGNYEDVLKYIKISNAQVEIDTEKNVNIIKKIFKKEEKTAKKKTDQVFDFETFKRFFSDLRPCRVQVENCVFELKDRLKEGKTHVSNAKIERADLEIRKDDCYFSLSSLASYKTYDDDVNGIGQNINVNIKGDGNFKKDFSKAGIDAVLGASHSDFGKIERLRLTASYEDDIVCIKKSESLDDDLANAGFNLCANIKTKEVSGNVKTKMFSPASLIQIYDKTLPIAQFLESIITCDASFHFKDTKEWSFKTDIDAYFPAFKVQGYSVGRTHVKSLVSGENAQLNIASCSFNEQRVDFFLKGKYNLDTQNTSGNLNITRLVLPSGETLSSNISFVGNKYSYLLNAPFVKVKDAVLENVHFSLLKKGATYDFAVTMEETEGGKYGFDGSFTIGKSKFLELHITLDSARCAHILAIANALTDKMQSLSPAIVHLIEDAQITTESYISTDFHDYSYNFVQVVLASISSDSLYTTFQVNGNNSSITIEKINFIFDKLDLIGRAQGYFEKGSIALDAFFSINSIAYNVSAIYSDRNLSIYGDYGITINMQAGEEFSGAVFVRELPLPVIDSIFSLDANFQIFSLRQWNFDCNLLKLTRGIDLSSHNGYDVEMKGRGNEKGLEFSEIRLLTNDLPLMGSLVAKMETSEKEEWQKAHLNLEFKNETTGEFFSARGEANLADKIYIDAKAVLANITLMRIFPWQSIHNKVSAELNILGSIDDFFVKFDLDAFNYSQSGSDIVVAGAFSADDKTIRVESCDVSWGSQKITDIEGALQPFDALGSLRFYYDGKIGNDKMTSDVMLSYSGGNKGEYGAESIFVALKRLASNFNIEATFSSLQYGDQLKKKLDVEKMKALLVREPGVIAISAGNNEEVYGVYLDDGTVSLHVDESLPIRCNVDGKITKEAIDLNCLALHVDMPLIWNLTPLINYVTFENGVIEGDIKISGTMAEPEFYSQLKALSVSGTSQYYAPELYGPVDIDVTLNGNMLTVPYTIVKGESARLYASVTSEFSGWIPQETIIKCGTLKNNFGIMRTKTIALHADGYASGDITLTITPGDLYLTGRVMFDRGYFSIPFADLYKLENKSNKGNGFVFRMDLDIDLGKKTEYRWPNNEIPILRASVPTEEPAKLVIDSSVGYVDLKGSSTIRGGEVFYINRNFYIREGSILFVASPQGFEPLVSMRAEIRDKDEGGEPVKIILTAKDQTLENFNPKVETFPPRSDAAVMQMLGQVFTSNVSKENFLQTALTTATDLVAQIGVFKKTESKIRDFLHVDTFSMRTLLLQNAVFGNLFKPNTDTPLTIGNYFDNTSVYIGKYFGSQIYADALLHLNYYDPLLSKGGISRKPVYGNLLFMPELGLEMSTPFFLLRTSIAPTRSDTLFVSDTKLTFSWKFSY